MKNTSVNKYVTFKTGFCFLFLFFSSRCFSQDITMKQTLDYINGKLGGRCSIDVSKGVLIALYKDNEEIFREDQVSISSLDLNTIKYDSEYHVFSINNKGAPSKKNVTRELFKSGHSESYKPYARISWEVNLDEKGENAMKKAFTHLIKLVMDSKYASSEPFE